MTYHPPEARSKTFVDLLTEQNGEQRALLLEALEHLRGYQLVSAARPDLSTPRLPTLIKEITAAIMKRPWR